MYLVYGEEAYWHDRIINLLSEHFGDGAENLAADGVTWSQIRELLASHHSLGPDCGLYVAPKIFSSNQPDDGWVHTIAPGNCLLLSSVTKENPAPKGFNKLLKDVSGKVIQASQPTFRKHLHGFRTAQRRWLHHNQGRFREFNSHSREEHRAIGEGSGN